MYDYVIPDGGDMSRKGSRQCGQPIGDCHRTATLLPGRSVNNTHLASRAGHVTITMLHSNTCHCLLATQHTTSIHNQPLSSCRIT